MKDIDLLAALIKIALLENKTPLEISKDLGITRSRVYQIAKEYNFTKTIKVQGNQKQKVTKVVWNKENLATLKTMVEDPKTPYKDICNHFGISYERIRQIQNKYGLKEIAQVK
jgi:DNA-directed RNA polymerase sigma subunit (sigma70/sigma32)